MERPVSTVPKKKTTRGSRKLKHVPLVDPQSYGESTAEAGERAGKWRKSTDGSLRKDFRVSPLQLAHRKRASVAEDALRDGLDPEEIVFEVLLPRADELLLDSEAEARQVLDEARKRVQGRFADTEAIRLRQMVRLEKSAERAFSAREYTAHASLERTLSELAGTKAPERIEMRSTAVVADMGGAEIQRYLEALRGPLEGPKARAFEVMTKLSTVAELPAAPDGPESAPEHGEASPADVHGAAGPAKQG